MLIANVKNSPNNITLRVWLNEDKLFMKSVLLAIIYESQSLKMQNTFSAIPHISKIQHFDYTCYDINVFVVPSICRIIK